MISYGQGPLGRIYERYRKASYRRAQRANAEIQRVLDILHRTGDQPEWNEDAEFWTFDQHRAYVVGVRDGLAAVDDAKVGGRVFVGDHT